MSLIGFKPLLQDLGALPMPEMSVAPLPTPTFPAPGAMDRQALAPPSGGGGGLAQILRLIAPMMTAGLALSGNKAAATGAAQGLVQNQARQQELELVRRNQQLREQEQAERQMIRQEQERLRIEQAERLRQQSIGSAVEDVRSRVSRGEFKTKGDYDNYVAFVEQSLSMLGVRPNAIRSAVPFNGPNVKDDAASAVNGLIKAHGVEVLTSGGVVEIDRDGDGIPERVPIAEAAKLGGVAVMLDPATGQPMLPPKEIKPANIEEFDVTYRGVLAEWKTDGKNVADPVVQGKAATEARRRINASAKTGTVSVVVPGPGGLPTATQRRVDAKARAFDTQPVVKRVQTQAEAVSFVTSLDINTTNPADDQALIYAFAKAMDPESVVREGEYATVQKYAQSWAEQFGFSATRVFSNTQFLTPQARANMKATIQKRYAATRRQYDNLKQSYVSQINRITGSGDGETYLTEYEAAFPGVGGESAGAAGEFQVKAPNGRTYTFATKEQLDAFKRAAGIK